ncbi:MAG: FecR domain-containing protein [Thermoplasmata archaeon]|nr:MAG: FecR domain-containing protein [Thermoplasmata archaeon]
MKTLNFFSLTILIVAIVLLMPTSKGIAQNSNQERFITEGLKPSIYGDLIAFQRGFSALYLYDLTTGEETLLATGHIEEIDFDGDKIVFDKNYDIYMYDLSTGIEIPICTSGATQWNASISDNRIVWNDHRRGWPYEPLFDIYMYDLSTGKETRVCPCDPTRSQVGGVISGNIIIWSEFTYPMSSLRYDVFMYDLSTGQKTPICIATGDQVGIDISGNLILWGDYHDPYSYDLDLYIYDLSTGKHTFVCTAHTGSGHEDYYPSVKMSGNLIVWTENRSGNYDIYLFDLSTGKEIPICTAPDFQCDLDISGNRIVWNDSRDGYYKDIYMYEYEGEGNIVGEIVSGNGNVFVNDVPVSSFESFKLKILDKVQTLTNSYAEIEFGESTVNLDQNSSFKVAENSTLTNITLNEVYGRLKAKLKKLSPEQVEIRTPQAICGVRGTDVLIEADDYETQVIMLENDSDVSTPDESQSIVLEELQGVVVTADGIGEPFPVNPNEIDRWWYRMLISVASPVDLYVTDPLGRHIGYTPTGGIVNEIPRATYTGPSSVPENIDIPYPILGNYEIDLTAVGTGVYHLSIAGMGMGDDTFYDEHSGSVETGEIISYQATCAETEVPMNVLIDIKPGSFPNAVNPNNWGIIPVSILTTDNFDAVTVDPATVRFGAEGTEAEPIHHALEDVDLDGDIDMIFHFKTKDTGIQSGDISAHLKGSTFNGKEFEGLDSITTVGTK